MTLYEKYGGAPTVAKVVEEFYRLNLEDDRIKHLFEGVNMEKLRAHQVAFVSKALGGGVEYSGRDMKAAHAHLSLTDEHFDAVVENLTDALDTCGMEEDDIAAVCGVLEPLRDPVLNR